MSGELLLVYSVVSTHSNIKQEMNCMKETRAFGVKC